MRRAVAATTAAVLCFTIVAPTAATATDDPSGRPAPIDHAGSGAIDLSILGTYETGVFDESAAEIVAHDPGTQRLYVVNAQAALVEVLDVSDPTEPTKITELVSPTGGTANSVDVRADGLVAVAVEDDVKTDPGQAQLWRADGDEAYELLAAVPVGALPDMLTFTPNGTRLLVANEGEPNDDFTLDPEGSVTIVDVTGDPAAIGEAQVRTVDFRAWDEGGRELPDGVRVFGPDVPAPAWQGDPGPGRIARNLEPEYIAPTDEGTAYVVLQEANTIAVLDVDAAEFTDLLPLGRKDHLEPGNELDVSDRDDEIRIRDWPVLGIHQPDGFDAYEVDGATYLVTANEGDGRDDWGDYEETARVNSLELCDDAFDEFIAADDEIDDLADLQADANLGRLTVSTAEGVRDGADCHEELHVLGGRSLSIWTADGELVFDSGSDFERITAAAVPDFFNSNHNENSFETRSDDKGPEPEDVTIGEVAGRTYAFIGFERIGGVIVYDITDPRAPELVRWVNNRDFSADPSSPEAGDLGGEGLIFIPEGDSPIDAPLLAVANEVSGTTTLWRIDGDELPEPPVRPTPPYDRGIERVCPTVVAPSFRDVAGSAHERAIGCLESLGLTEGTSDPTRFAPRRPVTRGQMASFVARLLETATGAPLPTGPDAFRDDDGSVHEASIDALAALGVVEGLRGGGFGPSQTVTRAQTASLLDRALDVLDDGELNRSTPPATDLDVFPDDTGSVHAPAIDRLAALGVVQGFRDGTYRPGHDVLRDQMASFLLRTLDAADELGLG